MAARILEGKEFARQFKEDAGKKALELKERYGRPPGLAVIIVGEDPASQVYVRNIQLSAPCRNPPQRRN